MQSNCACSVQHDFTLGHQMQNCSSNRWEHHVNALMGVLTKRTSCETGKSEKTVNYITLTLVNMQLQKINAQQYVYDDGKLLIQSNAIKTLLRNVPEVTLR